MNEKIFLFCIFVFVLFFASCTSRPTVYDNGSGASAVRNDLRELGEQQTETAIASEQLDGTIERSSNIVSDIKETISDGENLTDKLREIIRRIRTRRKKAEDNFTEPNKRGKGKVK